MGWLSGWGRRKKKTINGTAEGAQTDYQMLIIRVHKDTGTDTGSGNNNTIQHVYVGTNIRDDFGDVRFTKADGITLLDYCMEKLVNGSYADFVFKVDSIPVSPNTVDICVYYDKSDATTTSNGENTFPDFFDHFPGSNLDLTKWDVTLGEPVVENSYVKLTYDRIETDNDFPMNRALRMKVDPVTEQANKENAWGWSNGAGGGRILFSTYQGGRTISYESGWEIQDWTKDLTEKVYEVQRNGTTSIIFVKEGEVQNTHTTQVTTGNLAPCLFTDNGTELWCDWVAVRKFVSPEPTYGAFGSEETSGQTYEINVDAVVHASAEKAVKTTYNIHKDAVVAGSAAHGEESTLNILKDAIVKSLADLGVETTFCIEKDAIVNVLADVVVEKVTGQIIEIFKDAIVQAQASFSLESIFNINKDAVAEATATFDMETIFNVVKDAIIKASASPQVVGVYPINVDAIVKASATPSLRQTLGISKDAVVVAVSTPLIQSTFNISKDAVVKVLAEVSVEALKVVRLFLILSLQHSTLNLALSHGSIDLNLETPYIIELEVK